MNLENIPFEVQKAFKLTIKDLVIDEPWHYEDVIVYAKNHGEAKSKGIYEFELGQVQDYTKRNYNGEFLRDITFLDVRAKRVKEKDKFLFNGQWMTRKRIKQKEWESKRDEEAKQIWENNPYGIAVVYAGCYGSYWGANRCGYYSSLENAGKYSTEEAYKIVKGSDYQRQERVILLDKDKYNKELQEKADKLLKSMV